MSFIFKVVARNPPMALFVIATFMVLTGSILDDQQLTNFGMTAFAWGVIFQALWLIFKFRLFRD